jgi:hypothetical protein
MYVLLPIMKKQGSGKTFNLSSIGGHVVHPSVRLAPPRMSQGDRQSRGISLDLNEQESSG